MVSDSIDQNINLEIVGATFNDIFRSAHEASKKIGLLACNETTIETPKGIIVMLCSGIDEKAHLHLIGRDINAGKFEILRPIVIKNNINCLQ